MKWPSVWIGIWFVGFVVGSATVATAALFPHEYDVVRVWAAAQLAFLGFAILFRRAP